MHVRNSLFSMAAAASLIVAEPAAAQMVDQKFTIRTAAFFAKTDTQVSLQGNGNLGDLIDLEADLGLDERSALPDLDFYWRINDDWVLNGQFYALSRRGSATLDREITIDDITYPVNASVDARLTTRIYEASIGLLLYQRPKFEFGPTLGLHLTSFAFQAEGQGVVGGVSGTYSTQRRQIWAPLPTVGGFILWRPTERLQLESRVDWLSLGIGDYRGAILNTEVGASYRVLPHINLGMLYRYVDYDLQVRRTHWTGEANYQFSGPAVFIDIGF
jgi:hypothetical protein